ncbi:MAG: 50S ribosomal protein L31e [Candidatus Micrarchaeia archaeon]
MAEELERIYTIPLRKAFAKSGVGRGRRAVALVRTFLSRHLKAARVLIEGGLNRLLLARGLKKPPRRIRVLARRDKEGVVRALPAEAVGEKEGKKGRGKAVETAKEKKGGA